MLSGEKAAVQLKEWPPAKRRDLLGGAALAAPTECCVVEVRGAGRLHARAQGLVVTRYTGRLQPPATPTS